MVRTVYELGSEVVFCHVCRFHRPGADLCGLGTDDGTFQVIIGLRRTMPYDE
jgi:hypothetical protein